MSCRKPEDEPSTSQGKRRRINEEKQQPNVTNNEASNQLAIVAVPTEANEGTRPQIFKLDVDCVQEMFDYLSIKDIHSVSETCTRMQRIVADYFQPHLAALELEYGDGDFKTFLPYREINGFKEFVQKLKIDTSTNDEGYRFIGQHCRSLKQIRFHYNSQLNQTRIEYIKPILSKIETVIFGPSVTIEGEFYEGFMQFCPNLKRLRINLNRSNPIIGTNNKWLHRSYPTLEHLELQYSTNMEIPELGIFFERNPSLLKLSLDDNVFLLNINAILNADIKLQELTLNRFIGEQSSKYLKQLHDRGFYQRLHLQVISVDQQTIDEIASLQKLELCLEHNGPTLNLNSLTNLKQLDFSNILFTSQMNLQLTAKSLVNLERLYIHNTTSKVIDPFVEYSAKLKAIKIKWLKADNFIDLSALNKKRAKLEGARKVTIYLNEKSYLVKKWGNKTTDFKMIEVKRGESYDWPIISTIFPDLLAF